MTPSRDHTHRSKVYLFKSATQKRNSLDEISEPRADVRTYIRDTLHSQIRHSSNTIKMEFKTFVVVLQVLVIFSAILVEGGLISNAKEGFAHLGKSLNPAVINEETRKIRLSQSYYYTSLFELPYAEVAAECERYYGPACTLLYIETMEEFANLNTFLSRTQYSSLYWTGGGWNTTSKAFHWGNGVPMASELESMWEEGYPESQTEDTKITINNEFQMENLRFRTNASLNDQMRFICELDLGDWVCRVPNDVVFLLEATYQIGGMVNFRRSVDFVHDMADAWFANSQNRLSLIVFGTVVDEVVSLDNAMSLEELHAAIESAFYHASNYVNTHLVLNRAFNEFEAHPSGNLKNVVLLTANPSALPALTLQSAQKLLDADTEIFTLGVGEKANPTELLAITGNKHDHVFTAEEYVHLVRLLRPVKETIC